MHKCGGLYACGSRRDEQKYQVWLLCLRWQQSRLPPNPWASSLTHLSRPFSPLRSVCAVAHWMDENVVTDVVTVRANMLLLPLLLLLLLSYYIESWSQIQEVSCNITYSIHILSPESLSHRLFKSCKMPLKSPHISTVNHLKLQARHSALKPLTEHVWVGQLPSTSVLLLMSLVKQQKKRSLCLVVFRIFILVYNLK